MDKLQELEKIVDEIAGNTGPSRDRPTWALDANNLDASMNSVPLFMKNLPEDTEDNVALAALQTLKFDGTPEENALNFKELGNECFRAGKTKYQDAIQYFTQALDQHCKDDKLNVICLINRAAVNLELGNYRKVLNDCSKALTLDPKNIKALYRSSKALLLLERPLEAIDCCDFGLSIEPENESLKTVSNQAKKLQEKIETKERIKKEKEEAEALKAKELKKALEDANVTMVDSNDKKYTPDSKSNYVVTFDRETQQLVWPVFFLYPEFKESDFIEKFYENNTFKDHLEVMFEAPAPWDDQSNPKYNVKDIEIYFEAFPTNITKPKLFKIGKGNTLRQVLSNKNYQVVNGTPSFFILSKTSKFKEEFINKYKE